MSTALNPAILIELCITVMWKACSYTETFWKIPWC